MQVRPFALPRPRRYDELHSPPGAGLNAHWLAGEVVSRETDSGKAEMLCLAATTTGRTPLKLHPRLEWLRLVLDAQLRTVAV